MRNLNKVHILIFLFMIFLVGFINFSRAGNLVYSTFLGGNAGDRGYGIAIDSAGNMYVTGYTRSSTDFPTTLGAIDTSYDSGSIYGDIFVAKLTADGSALIYKKSP